MDFEWLPFLAPDSGNIDDMATDAIVELLGSGGIEQISMSAVARFGGQLPIRLPESPNEVQGVRAWTMLRALAEGERRAGRNGCADMVAEVCVEERHHVRRHLRALRQGDAPSDDQMQVVMLLADGVRESIADPEGRLSLVQGRALLAETLGQLLGVRFEEPRSDSWLDD